VNTLPITGLPVLFAKDPVFVASRHIAFFSPDRESVVKSSAPLFGLLHSFGEGCHDLVDIPESLTVPSLAKNPHAIGGFPKSIREMCRYTRIRTRVGRRAQAALAGRAQTLHPPMADCCFTRPEKGFYRQFTFSKMQ